MSASQPNPGERVRAVHLTEDTLGVDLADGRTIIVPLAWYPRLLDASTEQRSHWKISGAGYGIHRPDVDEDLSTEGLLRGASSLAPLSRSRAAAFQSIVRRSLPCFVRKPRGPDVFAACGQLQRMDAGVVHVGWGLPRREEVTHEAPASSE